MPPEPTRLDRLAHWLRAREPKVADPTGRKPAAVAVIAVPDPDSLLLIQRAKRDDDRWSGQMAFPGGRWQPEDPDLLATAKRETREEVGLDLDEATLLGTLDDIAPTTPSLPPVVVRPFVLLIAERLPLHPNHEVAQALWVEIDSLLQPESYRRFEHQIRGANLFFPGYHLPAGVVWGMTERILTPILGVLRD